MICEEYGRKGTITVILCHFLGSSSNNHPSCKHVKWIKFFFSYLSQTILRHFLGSREITIFHVNI